MKNTKAVFFIVLGAFLIATGFAFAAPEDSKSFQLLNSGVNFDTRNDGNLPDRSGGVTLSQTGNTTRGLFGKAAAKPAAATNEKDSPTTVIADSAQAASIAAAAAAAVKPPEKAPTTKEKVDKFMKDNMDKIALTAIGAFCGFALFGPIGILFGAVAIFGFNYYANL